MLCVVRLHESMKNVPIAAQMAEYVSESVEVVTRHAKVEANIRYEPSTRVNTTQTKQKMTNHSDPKK